MELVSFEPDQDANSKSLIPRLGLVMGTAFLLKNTQGCWDPGLHLERISLADLEELGLKDRGLLKGWHVLMAQLSILGQEAHLGY